MTAEVAVLNKQAVALAADSAVTTSDGKIFNTVKLFALSKFQPVGIMVYSSAEVMGVPVETIIKEFRRSRGREKCDHLEDYAEAFENFIRNDNTLFREEDRIRSLNHQVAGFSYELLDVVMSRLHRIIEWGHPTKAEAKEALSDGLSIFERKINQAKPLDGLSLSKSRSRVTAIVGQEIEDQLSELGNVWPLDTTIRKRFKRLAIDQLIHDVDFAGSTGFVLAGFGTQDVFPRLRAFEVCCSSPELHKVRSRVSCDISSNRTAAQIVPFAQRDVMKTFVEGKAELYDGVLLSFIAGFFEEKKRMAVEGNPDRPDIADLMDSLCRELWQGLSKEMARVTREEFIFPTMGVVSSMPKEELAILAEALINLTSLKRKASRDAETVGGPTDVAVISKGDGLIWIKRKHYFDPAVNPAFHATYLERGDV